jgi:hypothetical protein
MPRSFITVSVIDGVVPAMRYPTAFATVPAAPSRADRNAVRAVFDIIRHPDVTGFLGIGPGTTDSVN